jgi:hypothetical protein
MKTGSGLGARAGSQNAAGPGGSRASATRSLCGSYRLQAEARIAFWTSNPSLEPGGLAGTLVLFAGT